MKRTSQKLTMNKENRSAAGLRRSAIAERIRLREEWSELKGRQSQPSDKQKNILTKKQPNATSATNIDKIRTNVNRHRKPSGKLTQQTDSILCGVVSLVEVGAEPRALPLRAALAALGATVLPTWSPLVTHLVWSDGGCRATRARARALACRLVSPLWVEACAAAARRLPEVAFPAAARASDLPSPRTLTRLLKKAESENISLSALLSNSTDEKEKQLRLRLSENDTSCDTSHDMSHESHGTSKEGVKSSDKAPQRAKPVTSTPVKSRRKLFTQKEVDTEESEESDCTPRPRKPSYRPPRQKAKLPMSAGTRAELAKAERLARKIVSGCTPANKRAKEDKYKIVLSGMCRSERQLVSAAVRALGGRLQPAVDRRTTHVLLGSFQHEELFTRTAADSPTQSSNPPHQSSHPPAVVKPRTVSALCGAARGCRVLRAQWAVDSKVNGSWLHHYGYEVPHLYKLSQKARLERWAWSNKRTEYAYDVFCGMRVRLSRDTERRDAAAVLLRLCGALLQRDDDVNENIPTQNLPTSQNGGRKDASQYYVTQRPECEFDVRVGSREGDVCSRWVFDSVAAGRMRNTRRYIVTDDISEELAKLGC